MMRKLLLRLGLVEMTREEKLARIEQLYKETYEELTLDKINKKLIRPVVGLVIDGVQYWEFVNIADMPETRRMHYGMRRKQLLMNMSDELLLEYIDNLKKAVSEGNDSRAHALLWMMENIIKELTTEETMYNIAAIAYFDDKEDVAGYDLDYNLRKIEKFKTVRDKGFFFTNLLQRSLNVSLPSLQDDIRSSLNQNAEKLNAFNQILRGRSS